MEFETTADGGGSPVDQIQQFKKYAERAARLEQAAKQVDGVADSMKVRYDEDNDMGRIVLYFEFYDEEGGE